MIRFALLLVIVSVGLAAGCGKEAPAPAANNAEATAAKSPAPAPPQPPAPAAPKPVTNTPAVKPLSLGAFGGNDSSSNSSNKAASVEESLDNVLEAMQPLQVFLGSWNTTTRSMGAGSAKWVWDFKTDKSQPALVMSTKDHPYFETVRLTFLTEKQKFQLSAKDKENQQRTYEGAFTEKPHFVTGDSGKPEPRFEMMLEEVGNDDARKLAGVKLTQRYQDRLHMEVLRRSGKSLVTQDTVANQREGTSFAVSDTDYGDKECIVSQGLGTTAVTYMGRTYYVCCSGCQAAFTDDPTFWITKAEERKKAGK